MEATDLRFAVHVPSASPHGHWGVLSDAMLMPDGRYMGGRTQTVCGIVLPHEGDGVILEVEYGRPARPECMPCYSDGLDASEVAQILNMALP